MTTAIRPMFLSYQLPSGLKVPGELAPQFGLGIGAMPEDGFSTGPESLEQRALAMARDLGIAMVHDGSPKAIERAARLVGATQEVPAHPVAPAEKTFRFASVQRAPMGEFAEQGVLELHRGPDRQEGGTIIYYQVNLGERPSAGYAIHVQRVVQSGGKYYIYYREEKPALGAPAAKVMTKPYELIVVWDVPKGVQFVLKNVNPQWRQIAWQGIAPDLIEYAQHTLIPEILAETTENLIDNVEQNIIPDLVEGELEGRDYQAQVVSLLVHLSAIFYLKRQEPSFNRQEYYDRFGLNPRSSLVMVGIESFYAQFEASLSQG